MSESENETKGFKVTDRRKFTSEGEPRSESDAASRPEPPQEEKPTKQEAKPRADTAEKKEPDSSGANVEPPPEVQLVDLIHMLATNALVMLGDSQDPGSGERAENLQGAQVMIAFLILLQEKTKGNLDKEEEKILDDMLYDLRMRFLAKANLIKH
jgi:hypothetical protein